MARIETGLAFMKPILPPVPTRQALRRRLDESDKERRGNYFKERSTGEEFEEPCLYHSRSLVSSCLIKTKPEVGI